ncbi:MAG: DNA translocase FtsK 4TM domain-containing protein [Planctomycetes bacterium]|nr:DNA translocase FtsK 4TM domain-containing protein [Planctomycetota bacterium]
MARKSKAHAARKKASQADLPEAPMVLRIAWVTMAAVWIFFVVSLATFDSGDAPSHVVAVHNQPAANLCGAFGAVVAYWAYSVIGVGSWILLAGIAGLLGVTVTGRVVTHPVVRGIGVAFMAIAVSCLHRLIFPHTGPLAGAHAGIFAEAIVIEMVPRFSFFGSLLLMMMSFCIGAVVAVDRLALAVPRFFFQTVLASRGLRMPSMNWLPSFERKKPAKEKKPKKSRKRIVDSEATIDPDAGGIGAIDSFDPEEYEVVEYEEHAEEHLPRKLTPAELREKIAKLPVRIGASSATIARDEDIPREDNFEGYQFPTLDLLIDPEMNFSKKMEAFVRQQAQSLEESLHTYGIDGEVAGIESGPTVTLYSIQLSPGTKVSKISAISSDLARSLKTQNVRIVPNIVGRSTIGIEVPNLKREKVRLKELMSSGAAAGMGLPMFLGKDAAGDPLVADLTKMPHMLIAGTTGSGKSVCMNSIIMSWIYTKRPDELKLVLVDPKMVELSQFANIPHLMCPVVTETPRAAAILEWAVTKMEERYELLREAMVQNVAAYNLLSEEELYERFEAQTDLEKAKIPKKLPYMVFVVDELADLMMASNDVEHSVVRIAQKARAVGIHLILATQRPQANVVTGLIKSNMPCRISFKVASGMDSRIVLDQKGAELLLGQGDMLFLSPHTTELKRAQGTLVELPEIRKVMKFVKEIAAPNFERSLMAIRPDQSSSEDPMTTGERDPLFDQSVEVMIESGRGSVSLLQRRLAIGYSRASRLVDQMAQAGILGTHKGSVAREVLITIEDWAQMREMEERAETYGKLSEEESRDLGEASFDDGPVPAEIGNEYKM